MRNILLLVGMLSTSFVLSGCSGQNPLDYLDRLDTEGMQKTVEKTVDTMQEEAEHMMKATKEGLEQPVNAADATGDNVRTREQMMEDAGGKMIDEMR